MQSGVFAKNRQLSLRGRALVAKRELSLGCPRLNLDTTWDYYRRRSQACGGKTDEHLIRVGGLPC